MMSGPSTPYVLPFVAFLVLLALDGKLGLSPGAEYPLRVVVLAAILWTFSRKAIDWKVRQWPASVGLGLVVFLIWVAPDFFWPAYRTHWLFQNSYLGSAPVPNGGYSGMGVSALVFRSLRAVVLVPIIEELFWRNWLMRWLIRPDFQAVPLGTYSRKAFWITAAFFALEHGAYWDVGLAAGILYNWWMIRTRSLGDCILAHAVTNAVLSAYVLGAGKWQYW
ncbi:MAG: CAAX prenyl protease-related protein [Candidatus Solibacter usitatus]|nr:CAAX prenyl protease-related protein [Candidatus Solibacter usitatus]